MITEDTVGYVAMHLEFQRQDKIEMVRKTRYLIGKEQEEEKSYQSRMQFSQTQSSMTLMEKQNRLLMNIKRR